MSLLFRIATRIAPKALHAFPNNDGHHHQASQRIRPPQAERGIQQQSAKEDRREINTKISLPSIGDHSSASELRGHFALSTREQRHDEERTTGDDDSEEAVFGSLPLNQVARGLVAHVGGERKETYTHDSERHPLELFTAGFFGISVNSPEQRGSGRDFDEAVYTKTDERDATRKDASQNRKNPFEAVPDNCEILERLPAPKGMAPV